MIDADTLLFIYIFGEVYVRSMNGEGLKAPNAKNMCGYRAFDPLEKSNLPSAKNGAKT